jgi:hypothetical protein
MLILLPKKLSGNGPIFENRSAVYKFPPNKRIIKSRVSPEEKGITLAFVHDTCRESSCALPVSGIFLRKWGYVL